MTPLSADSQYTLYQAKTKEKRHVLARWREIRIPLGWPFALLALLLFDFIFVKGYQFGVEDHTFYLPQLQAELDPSLYPDSDAIVRSTSEFSFFNKVFATLAHALGLEWTFLLTYLAASYSFYLVCFLLAEKLFADRLVSFGFLVLLLPLTEVSGTATRVWDNYLTHRGVVLPLCLWGMYQIFNGKHALAYFFFGLAGLIHPITAVTFAIACFAAVLYDVWTRQTPVQTVLLTAGMFLLGVSPLLWKVLHSPATDASFFAGAGPEWIAIVRDRAPYMLPSSWSAGFWSRGVWFLLLLSSWLAKPRRRREDILVFSIAASCGALLLLSLIVSAIIPFLPLARFEFARSLLIVILLARLYLAAAFCDGFRMEGFRPRVSVMLGAAAALSLTTEFISPLSSGIVLAGLLVLAASRSEWLSDGGRKVAVISFSLVAVALFAVAACGAVHLLHDYLSPKWRAEANFTFSMFGLAVIVFGLSVLTTIFPRWRKLALASGLCLCLAYISYTAPGGGGVKTLHLPGRTPVTPWIQAQLWAKEHTAKNAIFLTPWRKAGFPVFSQRSVVGDWKSGGDAKFNLPFARTWRQWKQDFANVEKFTTQDFCRLHNKYAFHYIVTENQLPLQFSVVYQNQEFAIYRYTDSVCQ